VSTDPDILDPSIAESRYLSLYDAHFADIWRFARRRSRSSQDTDDATAETFAIAWRRRDEVPTEGARLWLFGVARRVLANHRRSIERQDKVTARLVETVEPNTPADVPRESQGVIWEALGALSADDRELLIMRAWDELSVGEMAVILGCSPNAVSLRVYKARRRLAHELRRKENPGSGHVAGGSLSTEGGTS
jgi:RNA polymerase sigma-70 factor (ECF subfamily)